MSGYWMSAMMVLLALAADGFGQAPAGPAERNSTPAWRPVGDAGERAVGTSTDRATEPTAAATPSTPQAAAPVTPESARRSIAKVTSGNGTLPNEQGQIWREYDISPYTMRVTATERPEQALVDWILRETGYEAWHSEPLGILSATRKTLRVYHTPAVQAVVAELVDRFLAGEGETNGFGVRVITIDSPSWRARAQRLLRPVNVQTPGTSAWLLEKEDAAVLLAELQRRSDFREHTSPRLLVSNGQSSAVSVGRARPYVRGVALRPDLPAGYEAQLGQVEEGFALDFSPLLSTGRKMIDATIKCDIDQVEKLVPVVVDVPTPAAPRQRTKIEVPQMTHFRFHERFRWPVDQVLLVGMGMVALPIPVDGKPSVVGIPLPSLGSSPARADLLVFVECKGATGEALRTGRDPQREARTYRGRY
jgi:hypothetical protein